MESNQMTVTRTRTMTKMALCVALLAISAYLSFPLPFTPTVVTALTIIVNLVAFILPPKQAALVITTYILLGMAGMPVFVNGSSGASRIFGPTGGFIWGFLFAAWLMSLARNGSTDPKRLTLIGIGIGMPVIYICGCISMYLVAHLGIMATLTAAVFPFIIGDVVKVLIAVAVANKLNQALNSF